MPVKTTLATVETFLRRMDERIGGENRRMRVNLAAWAGLLDALGWNVALALPGEPPLLNRGALAWAAGHAATSMTWEEITDRLAQERPARELRKTPELVIWADEVRDGGHSTDLPLTRRQREVLGWLREGKTGPEIAIILGCGQRTVESHVAGIYRKLGVHRRAELMLQSGREVW